VLKRTHLLTIAAVVLAASCRDGQPLAPEATPDLSVAADVVPGAVYLTSNDAGGNSILLFDRASDGSLAAAGSIPTLGLGTSDGLGNQQSIVLTQDKRFLYVVNAGSDDITGFRVTTGGLERIGAPVASGGDLPVSLTVHGNRLYVLNGGTPSNISGFRIAQDGSLSALAGSSQPLSGAGTGPAQIAFTPNGTVLVVTEKATNTITTYGVGADGLAGAPQPHASAGLTPFGFNFNQRGDLVVSEADGTGTGTATASSYRIGTSGALTLVSGPVATTQVAACWIAIGENGRYAYTTNTGSGTVSLLAIDAGARLQLAQTVAAVTGTDSRPQDATFTPGGRFLYVRNAEGSISAFLVEADGALTEVGNFGPIPAAANGIAAR
jgi:6-phosphogluconolactonase (cycloisomerase 2 family)